MVSVVNNDRAALLAREAVELVEAGHHEAASRTLREAISIAPENQEVRTAFRKVQDDELNIHVLLNLCRRYVSQCDEEAGTEAVMFLFQEGLDTPGNVTLDCLKLLLACPASKLNSTQDDIIGALVRQSASCRQYFASELKNSVTHFFDEIYDRGDGSVVCLDTVVLDHDLWESDEARRHCESELMQLFIAKLMESGHDHDGRSLKGIARLLVVDAESLQHLIDEEGFDVILSSLDLRLPLDVRSQATLATAKYLEASQEAGQALFTKVITGRVSKRRQEDHIIAFSAAAAVFPLLPAIASSLFLSEGFLQSLSTMFSRRKEYSDLELSILELFNAACIDRACREAIGKYHSGWLEQTLGDAPQQSAALAAVIMAKIQISAKPAETSSSSGVQEMHTEPHEFVERFKESLSKQPMDDDIGHVIEGLAYTSVKPAVKEQLATDSSFLKSFFQVLMDKKSENTILYGGLMTICNITKFRPNLSEEQKRLAELRAYANTSKPEELDPLDDEDHVKSRCNAVIDAEVMPLLIECEKSSVPSAQNLCHQILLALSRDSKSRPKLAQQGAVKLLVASLNRGGDAPRKLDDSGYTAAHALARILISVNPSHVFSPSGFPQLTSSIRPLLLLLAPFETTSDQPRDLLPAFEGLLALTNVASSPDRTAGATIVRAGWTTIEDLLLSDYRYLQRAACELVCNLMTCEAGVSKFADGSQRASQRLHIILALADVDDVPTRRAAGGALAMLTEFQPALSAIMERPRGMEIILTLCRDGEEQIVHRGVVCIQNMLHGTGGTGRRAKQMLVGLGAVNTLQSCIRRFQHNPALVQSGVQAMTALVC